MRGGGGVSTHEEFPELTPEARAVYHAALNAIQKSKATISSSDLCRALAACLREAMKQADKGPFAWLELEAIANNLHNPPPPPPTLAEARAADLSTPEGQATARAFLATLGEGEKP